MGLPSRTRFSSSSKSSRDHVDFSQGLLVLSRRLPRWWLLSWGRVLVLGLTLGLILDLIPWRYETPKISALYQVLYFSSQLYTVVPCDAHSPYGTHNTWCYPLSRDLISFESAISRIARFALHVGLVTLRLSGE